ncbi:ABC transporter ATP-binding protein [Ensifer adhaerens]|uniref:ABC transporter ATP-binding protein n=1 Tax=Ensifer adhaerens TaxID=106592 RepID=UPI001CBB3B6E|nr:ABC transporter ATP-binding protein [Ensifer adhaerens]MBZ7927752.1 ABC transporter ATP-binding protein [Ensifer adhaerens]UAX96608.1 ABC transporter ATP-binding protein [Ensifer adhaerens]UAY04048.1 ABC transporter ATP-binding protein [Ensifer adhaerens]UAY12034.1 ABC transporter ATP-binding protein [Ensifer adhaerens]
MLELRNVNFSYGGVKAVQDVSLDVATGQIVGLIGTNGAGKTTLFNIVSGFNRAASGSIMLQGRNIAGSAPVDIAAQGLIRTFQTPIGFPRLTVYENMLVFSDCEKTTRRHLFAGGAVAPETRDRAMGILELFGLASKRDTWAENLSAPELKMLEFARAIMAAPRLLLLDEPAAGVNPALLESLGRRIVEMRDGGATFLIVDHNLKFICDVCDYIFAMADGKVIAHGKPDEILATPAVIDLYIGSGRQKKQ